MPVIDRMVHLESTPMAASADPDTQVMHASSPKDTGFQHTAGTLTWAVGGFMILIYLLHVVERAVKA